MLPKYLFQTRKFPLSISSIAKIKLSIAISFFVFAGRSMKIFLRLLNERSRAYSFVLYITVKNTGWFIRKIKMYKSDVNTF